MRDSSEHIPGDAELLHRIVEGNEDVLAAADVEELSLLLGRTFLESLAQLPTRQRDVMALHLIRRMTLESIADQLGLSMDTVKRRVQEGTRNVALYLQTTTPQLDEEGPSHAQESRRLESTRDVLVVSIEDYLRRTRIQDLGPAEMAKYLQDALGAKLIALVVGVTDAGEVVKWARGEEQPGAEVQQRLRAAFDIVQVLLQAESPEAVRSWFLGMNPELDDRAPALVLAEDPDLVAEAARTFLATG